MRTAWTGRSLVGFLMSTTGCSFLFVQPLEPTTSRYERLDCTTNRTAPVIDTILTATNLGSAIYVAGQDNVTNKGTAVTAGVTVALLWMSSAIYGYTKTSECEDAVEAQDRPYYAPPRLLRPRPPSMLAPPRPPPPPPPPASSPAAPDAPEPADDAAPPVQQQQDEDDPSPGRRPAPRPPGPRPMPVPLDAPRSNG
jgi:hypothetical protein